MKIYPLLTFLLLLLPVLPTQAAEKLIISEYFDNTIGVYGTAPPTSRESSLAVGVSPTQIGISPTGNKLYLANFTTADISVIDTASLSVSTRIELPCRPSTLAISADGTSAYATCRSIGKIVHIDLTTDTAADLIPVTFPQELALDPGGKIAYVSRTMFSHYLYVVDLDKRQVIDTIIVGRAPKGVLLSPDGHYVYVANAGSGSLSVIDTATRQVVNTISVSAAPNALAIDNSGLFLYVAHDRSNQVSIVNLNTATMVAEIGVGLTPQRMALSEDNTRLYVTNFDSNTLSVIDTTQQAVVATLATGNGPFDVLLLKNQAPPQS